MYTMHNTPRADYGYMPIMSNLHLYTVAPLFYSRARYFKTTLEYKTILFGAKVPLCV